MATVAEGQDDKSALASTVESSTEEQHLTPAVPPAEPERVPSDAPSETHSETMDQQASDKVQALHQVFTQTDEELLEAVLVAHHGSVEAATDSLLAMSDPTYKPEHLVRDEQSRLDADAEFARALQYEDEQRARLQRRGPSSRAQPPPQEEQRPPIDPSTLTYQPYVPRRKQTGQPQSPQQQQQQSRQPQVQGEHERDELDQLTEQFTKFAEQGKRTFGTLFGKAREGLSQLNDTINQQVAQAQANVPTGGPPPTPPKPASERANAQPWQPPSSLPRPMSNEPARESSSVVPERLPRPAPLQRDSSTRSEQPYQIGIVGSPDASDKSSSGAPVAAASNEPKKDFSKIGLLPRQSVSLLEQRDTKKDGNDSDDDDDLEYVRSPFDDD